MPASPKYEFHVPGAYHFDNPPFPTRALGADVFLPPVSSSPSGSVLNLAQSTSSFYSDLSAAVGHENGATAKRKRAAQDSRETTPLAEWGDMSLETPRGRPLLPPGTDMARGGLEQDGVKTGIAYTLAGQIDISGAPVSGVMDDSIYSDIEYRRGLGPHRLEGDVRADELDTVGRASQTPEPERWTVLNALGSVVGKVWEFCTTGAFRGFHAGGGDGYDWETGAPTALRTETPTGDTQIDRDNIRGNFRTNGEQWPGTGRFADDRPSSDLPLTAFAFDGGAGIQTPDKGDATPRRHGKRRQVGLAGDELGHNWVMVDFGQNHSGVKYSAARPVATRPSPSVATRTPDRRASQPRTSTPGSTSRRINVPISRFGPTSAHNRRPRVSHAGSPALSPREPASFASPRSPAPTRRPVVPGPSSPAGSRIPVPLAGADSNPFARAASPRPGSRAGVRSTGLNAIGLSPSTSGNHGSHSRRYSGKPGASPLPKKPMYDAVEGTIGESPRLNDEAKKLAAQNFAAEQDADAKMEAFNLRLKEMIRQGKEALGTTFEVDGDGEQEEFWADDI